MAPHVVISFLFNVLLMANVTRAAHSFASAAEIQLLYQGELDLVDALKTYLNSEQSRLDQLRRSVKKRVIVQILFAIYNNLPTRNLPGRDDDVLVSLEHGPRRALR